MDAREGFTYVIKTGGEGYTTRTNKKMVIIR